MGNAVSVKNLQKKYDDNTVLKGISFDVHSGEIFALLGINGAGKTTALECIEGVRRYNGGNIEVDGKIGVQLQVASLMPECKVREAIELFKRWNHDQGAPDFSSLGIESISGKMYKTLSIGQKKRLHLALAVLGNPDIIILDEPTAGLDVEGRVQLHDVIRKLNKAGKTILLASHDMAEVEELCDRIAILRDGLIVYTGTPSALREQESGEMTTLQIQASADLSKVDFTYCHYVGTAQNHMLFSTSSIADGLLELLSYAKNNGVTINDIQTEHASLEQRFMEVSKGV